MSYEEIGEILRLIEQIDCQEMMLEWGDVRIHVRRTDSATSRDGAMKLLPSLTASDTVRDTPGTERIHSEEDAGLSEYKPARPPEKAPLDTIPAGSVAVTAPLMGTFYRAPAPGKPPFTEEGSTVEHGDTLGIIELMKLMNHVQADVAGKVVRIDVRDGEMVEYGQELIWVAPSP